MFEVSCLIDLIRLNAIGFVLMQVKQPHTIYYCIVGTA